MENPLQEKTLSPEIKDSYLGKNGLPIRITKMTKDHLLAHPVVIPLLEEAIVQLEIPSDGSAIETEVDLHRPLQKNERVEAPYAGLDDEATFAMRKNRRGASRVIEGVEGPVVSTVVIIAAPTKADTKDYILRAAYIGTRSPMEPWSPLAVESPEQMQKSLDFWSKNALVYKPETMEKPFLSTWRKVMAQAAEKKVENGGY